MEVPSYIAFHEAGHAVMAVLEHLPIDRATIMQEGEALGHVQHDAFNMTDDEPLDAGFLDFEQIRAEKNARVALAGEIAQTIHDAASVDPDHAESDRHQPRRAAVAEHARQALRELPYGHWRDYNPEETVRFYALRLHEAGMVKSPPQKLIGQGTDWRALDQLKRELKI